MESIQAGCDWKCRGSPDIGKGQLWKREYFMKEK